MRPRGTILRSLTEDRCIWTARRDAYAAGRHPPPGGEAGELRAALGIALLND